MIDNDSLLIDVKFGLRLSSRIQAQEVWRATVDTWYKAQKKVPNNH